MDLRRWRVAVLVVALLIAFAHSLYIRIIFRVIPVGVYFLVAAILFAFGGLVASLSSGKLFRSANLGLIVLSILDNVIIFYTRIFPLSILGGRVLSWSTSWIPPGAVQVLIAQIVMIILSALVLLRSKLVG